MKLAICAAALAAASAVVGRPKDPLVYSTVIDDFKGGFSANTATSKWNYFNFGPYEGNDGVAVTNGNNNKDGRSGGLRIVSPGKSPSGEPAFTLTAAPNGSIPGDIEHVKWLVFANHTSAAGFPGYDTAAGYVTSCETQRLGGRTYGTERQPFGPQESATDPNLAWFGSINGDFEKFMIFDFALTNDAIYAFYERLPFGRTPEHNYASFSALTRVAKRHIGQEHDLKVSYDRSARTVTWYIGGREVYKITRIGHYPPNRDSVYIDRGGVEEDVGDLRQLVCGLGTFTLLDGFNPKLGKGLVKLNPQPEYYHSPSNQTKPLAFVDETSADSSRLFGQGAELTVSSIAVSSTKAKCRGSGNSGGGGKGNGP